MMRLLRRRLPARHRGPVRKAEVFSEATQQPPKFNYSVSPDDIPVLTEADLEQWNGTAREGYQALDVLYKVKPPYPKLK